VGKVTDIVAEIAVASQEQARGIEQVNKAITEMDKVVQQSAANSEESSSAAEELAGQSQEMAAMVGKFKLNRTASTRRPQTTQVMKSATKRPAVSKSASKSNGNGHMSDYHLSPESIIPMDADPDFAEF
jgi:methyl-accepting chemotaxis protein